MQLISNELRPSVLKRTVTQFDIQIRQFSVGRALIAAAGLSIVQLTPYSALMQTVLGRADGPGCSGLRAVSAYCIFKEGPAVLPTVVLTLVFTLALLGVAPAIVGWLHAWAAYSIAASIAIPDGGDQAAVVFLVLIAVACSGDRRRWAFGVGRQVSQHRRQVALAGLMALRVQVA